MTNHNDKGFTSEPEFYITGRTGTGRLPKDKGVLDMWKDEYTRWKDFSDLDEKLAVQLEKIVEDEASLEDAFYKNLEFGTGGMRGKIGPGTNRMNIYTVRKAAEGLASYVNDQGMSKRGVAIAYDSRYMSKEFAVETAKVLGRHGIPSYVFTSLRPTPELSFAVRHLKAAAGVVVTASHNPPEYNGFKAYNEDGGQLPPAQAEVMIDFVNQVENELNVEAADQEQLEQDGPASLGGRRCRCCLYGSLENRQCA